MTTIRKAIQLFSTLSILIGLSSCSTEKKYDILITNTSVINVENGSITLTDLAILDNRIVKIDKNIPEKESNQIVDGSGKYIIPALWDMHVHFEGWGYEPMAKLMIANGVLGARDMGGNDLNRLDAMKAKLGNQMPNMRIIRPGRMLDGQTPGWPFRITVNDSSAAVNAVKSNKNEGVDFIKVHQQLNKESYLAIAEACKSEGLLFSGHVPVRVSGTEASDAGQLSFEHLTGTPRCANDDCSNIEELLELYKTNSTYQVPTLSIYNAEVQSYNTQRVPDDMKAYINSTVKKEWAVQDSINKQYLPPLEQMAEMSKMMAQGSYDVTRKMIDMDVPIVSGTDAGFVGVIPGFGLHKELELLVEEAGATPLLALQSATIIPAQMHQLELVALVKEGYFADLIILNSNPLEDINNTKAIDMVISNGEVLNAEALQKLKNECKNLN